jgi:SAM-dependent methyltransferase
MERMLEATARAEDHHFWFLGLRRTARYMLERALDRRTVNRIVDCGAGTGRNLEWLAGYGSATGVELSLTGLSVARAHGRRVVRATVAALPFASDSADVATSFDVLYCLDDETEAGALEEMHRILKPGGIALINVAALDVLRGSHSTLTHERRRYTPAGLRAKLVAAGFTVDRLTFTNLSAFPPAFAIRGIERLTGRASEASESDLAVPPWPVNAVMDMALRLEAGWLRIGNLPIGTSIMAVARKPGFRADQANPVS